MRNLDTYQARSVCALVCAVRAGDVVRITAEPEYLVPPVKAQRLENNNQNITTAIKIQTRCPCGSVRLADEIGETGDVEKIAIAAHICHWVSVSGPCSLVSCRVASRMRLRRPRRPLSQQRWHRLYSACWGQRRCRQGQIDWGAACPRRASDCASRRSRRSQSLTSHPRTKTRRNCAACGRYSRLPDDECVRRKGRGTEDVMDQRAERERERERREEIEREEGETEETKGRKKEEKIEA